MIFKNGRISSGKMNSDPAWPRIEGPSSTPASISPTTGGWPILRNSAPTRRATIRMIAIANRTRGLMKSRSTAPGVPGIPLRKELSANVLAVRCAKNMVNSRSAPDRRRQGQLVNDPHG